MRDDGTLAELAETWNLPVEGADYSTEVPSRDARGDPSGVATLAT